MTKNKKPLVVAAAMFAAAFACTQAPHAFAFTRRMSHVECFSTNLAETWAPGGLFNHSLTTDMDIVCPVINDTSLTAVNVTDLNVHGIDGNDTDSVIVSACYIEWDNGNGSCLGSASSGNSFTGQYTLTPSLWSSLGGLTSSDFSYVSVNLPDDGNPDPSSLRGYYLTD